MSEVKLVKSNLLFPFINEMLNSRKYVRITVTGMSMYPFLRENIDSIELSSVNFTNLHRNDIVMILRDSNEYVMHRVIKKENDCFYIVGDAQQWIEGPLRPNQLVAKITTIWRRNKKIDCTNLWWRLLSSLWLVLLPFRHIVIKSYSRFYHKFTHEKS